ncbi:MAG: hypothetical protein ACRDGA_11725, partial [Bacteroidota bacterium]
FPNYESSMLNYNGFDKAQDAFEGGSTTITVRGLVGGIPLVNFDDPDVLFRWAIENAGGSTNQENYGLDTNTVLLCAIEDVTFTGVTSNALGFTNPRFRESNGNTRPPRSYVLSSRIRGLTFDTYERVVYIVGPAIHELGHARGIPPNPSHSGSDAGQCVMQESVLPPSFAPQNGYANYYDPYFCEGHRIFLIGVTW